MNGYGGTLQIPDELSFPADDGDFLAQLVEALTRPVDDLKGRGCFGPVAHADGCFDTGELS